MTFSLDDLAMRRPANGRGIQISEAFTFDTDDRVDTSAALDSGLWFCVEMAVPSSTTAAVWGTALWGVGRWSQVDWVDLTARVRGVSWTRGGTSDALARSDVGDLEMTLDNRDGRLSVTSPDPITPPYYLGAGVFIRVGVYAPVTTDIADTSEWAPQFAGFTESWNEQGAGVAADRWVVATAVETLSVLAKVDEPELAPIGANETPAQRLTRLLADFPFPGEVALSATPNSVRLQPTTMAGNRISELYVLADSLDADLRSTPKGRIALTDKHAQYTTTLTGRKLVLSTEHSGDATYFKIDFDADSLTTLNDADFIVNSVHLAAVGSTVISAEDEPSIERFQRSSYSRMDMIYTSATQAVAAPWISSRVLARGSATYRPGSVTIDGAKSVDHLTACLWMEANDLVDIETPTAYFTAASIASYTHFVRPMQVGARWLTDIELGVSATYEWEAIDG